MDGGRTEREGISSNAFSASSSSGLQRRLFPSLLELSRDVNGGKYTHTDGAGGDVPKMMMMAMRRERERRAG